MHSTLRITQNCNLNCLHCYSHSPQKTKDLPTQKIKSIIDILTKNNITHITISGGEPFTRHDATELISYSAKKTKTGIVTNATLIDKATAKKLSEINLTRLMISLDGTESHH
ncbi:MAG: radical SAM protein, partial [Candidatus Aenigmarchaeota archaeon]|nr:radical SAM protein [Candidatus Aenigmarchaeota archaeon]